MCKDCFFVDHCQFYAKGIGLTLDDILCYVIVRDVPFRAQSLVVQWSASVTIIVFRIEVLLNNFLVYVVFHDQNTRRVYSGVSLLLSSLVSLLVVIR